MSQKIGHRKWWELWSTWVWFNWRCLAWDVSLNWKVMPYLKNFRKYHFPIYGLQPTTRQITNTVTNQMQHIFRHIFWAKFHSSLRLWQSLISFVQGKNVYYLHQNQDSVSDENKWILMADFLCDWRNTHITGTYVVAEDVRSYKL